jgi:hypothetical protein
MGFFKPKPPIDIDEFDWLIACFSWLHGELGNEEASCSFVPILARPDTPLIAAATSAAELFDGVKSLAGLEDWECHLEQGEGAPPKAVGVDGMVPFGETSEKYALGTFSVEGSIPVIHYNPELLRDPDALVATFAHELAHLLTHSLGDPPGGPELHEHATDCTAAYLGFGTFLANSARHFSQFSDGLTGGWQSSTSGYLSERALVSATAIFVRLFGLDPATAIDPLKPYLRKDYRKALDYLDWKYPDAQAALQAVDLTEWA